MWFQLLTGFEEESINQVQKNMVVKGNKLTSLVNGETYQCGTLEIPTLEVLRKRNAKVLAEYNEQIKIDEVIANVQTLHLDEANAGAFFQAASQFNLLEMVSPSVLPENGVDIYENDFTQGPACAIAAGAGTIYRNYFVELGTCVGQTEAFQINCLDELETYFNNSELNIWKVQNGYAFANADGLAHITKHINGLNKEDYDKLLGLLKIGVQWDTEITLQQKGHLVTQAYCSALPIGYSNVSPYLWKEFALLILRATYEATFYAAFENYRKTGNNRVYLTLVGGGVFGNNINWIIDAIERSLIKFKNTPLDVSIVSYGSSNYAVQQLIKNIEL